MRILHLTRNPAASVNGLYEGWLSPGFHSHATGSLAIPPYADRLGGERWWKFDLPPRWREYRRAPLEDVCVFQWLSAHQYVHDYLNEARLEGTEYFRLKFESIACEATRVETIHDLSQWIGATVTNLDDIYSLPLVMTTGVPAAFRWRARQSMIASAVMASSPACQLAADLGYSPDQSTWS
jgi:hypothetical protein